MLRRGSSGVAIATCKPVLGKYPAAKLLLVGEVENEKDTPVSVLVKFSHPPAVSVAVDDLVKLTDVECRRVWLNSQGLIPETSVIPHVANVELAVNLNPKRQRDALQSLDL